MKGRRKEKKEVKEGTNTEKLCAKNKKDKEKDKRKFMDKIKLNNEIIQEEKLQTTERQQKYFFFSLPKKLPKANQFGWSLSK